MLYSHSGKKTLVCNFQIRIGDNQAKMKMPYTSVWVKAEQAVYAIKVRTVMIIHEKATTK